MPFPPPVREPNVVDEVTSGPDDVNVAISHGECDGNDSLRHVPFSQDGSRSFEPLQAEPLLFPPPAFELESEPEASLGREFDASCAEPLEPTAEVSSEDPIIECGPAESSNPVELIASQVVLPLDASVEREPTASSMPAEPSDPAAALRGRRWIEPRRVSLRSDTPDSLGPTTRKASSHSRAQSAIAIALASAAVIAGAAFGIRVAMSRHYDNPTTRSSALSVPVTPSGNSLPKMPPSAASDLQVPPPVAPSSDVQTEPPSSATAPTTGVSAEPPVPKSVPRAKITRHFGVVKRAPPVQPNVVSSSGVPVDQIYVNKNGDLVDARGKPIHDGSTQPASPVNPEQTGAAPAPHGESESSEQLQPAPHEDSGQQHTAPPKDEAPPKSVDEAQPWH